MNKQSVHLIHLNENIFVGLKRNKKKYITYTNFNESAILDVVYFKIIGIERKIKLNFYKIKKSENQELCQKITTFTPC